MFYVVVDGNLGTSVKSNMGLFFNALQSNVNLPLENLDIQARFNMSYLFLNGL